MALVADGFTVSVAVASVARWQVVAGHVVDDVDFDVWFQDNEPGFGHRDSAFWQVEDAVLPGFVSHPFVVGLFASVVDAAVVAAWKSVDVAAAAERRDWGLWLLLHERPYRPRALAGLVTDPRVSDDQWWRLVGDTWTDTEFPSGAATDWNLIWQSPRPGRDVVMHLDEQAVVAALPDPLRVWRGGSGTRDEVAAGWSWTRDESKALWFAQRWGGGDATVVAGNVCRSDVLAVFDRRGESEVVVRPGTVQLVADGTA